MLTQLWYFYFFLYIRHRAIRIQAKFESVINLSKWFNNVQLWQTWRHSLQKLEKNWLLSISMQPGKYLKLFIIYKLLNLYIEKFAHNVSLSSFYFVNLRCGPCKVIAPQIEAMSKEMADVVFLKVDVDENEDAAQEYNISAMPTFIFIKNQAKVRSLYYIQTKRLTFYKT